MVSECRRVFARPVAQICNGSRDGSDNGLDARPELFTNLRFQRLDVGKMGEGVSSSARRSGPSIFIESVVCPNDAPPLAPQRDRAQPS